MADTQFSTMFSENQTTPHAGCTLVIFGASGDLAKKKLYPSLYQLYKRGMLPEPFHVVGFARTKMTRETFIAGLSAAYKYADQSFFSFLSYVNGKSYSDDKALASLSKVFEKHSQNRIFYLSVPPGEFRNISLGIKNAQLITQNSGSKENEHTVVGQQPFTRVVFEKPFGTDFVSARKLLRFISNHFRSDQVFPVDHYLGKEPIQNILYFRFANSVFENLWNGRYIDHMQITLNEEIGVEKRGGYFDTSGTMRDMIQSHALQVLALSCMEPPSSFTAENIRAEKAKLLELLHPLTADEVAKDAVRGQYEGYLNESGIAKHSMTETLVGFKVRIHNWRWSGVPVYIRSGKALSRRCTELVVSFKKPPYNMFGDSRKLYSNKLIFRFQPDTFLNFGIQTKVPGNDRDTTTTNMDFKYSDEFNAADYANGYDRILHSAFINDASIFLSPAELLAQWNFADSLISEWKDNKHIPLHVYPRGSNGPAELDALLTADDRSWNTD